jgi:hypothetical protein
MRMISMKTELHFVNVKFGCLARRWSNTLNIVAYRPVSGPRPQNKRIQPLLCNRQMNTCFQATSVNTSTIPGLSLDNCSVNGFLRQRIRIQQLKYCWTVIMETVFSMWFVLKCYKQSKSSSRESCQQFSCQLEVSL